MESKLNFRCGKFNSKKIALKILVYLGKMGIHFFEERIFLCSRWGKKIQIVFLLLSLAQLGALLSLFCNKTFLRDLPVPQKNEAQKDENELLLRPKSINYTPAIKNIFCRTY